MTEAEAAAAAEPPAQKTLAEQAPMGPPPVKGMLAMGGLFVVSIGLALVVAPLYAAEVGPIFEDPQNVGNAGIYLVIVVAFTGVILLIARYKLEKLIQVIILGAVLMTLVYVLAPLLAAVLRPAVGGSALDAGWLVGLAGSAVLTAALYKHPEWWVVDLVGVGVSAGAAAYFGISFGILPALALLIGFAAYDAIAVYRTKHMVDLADKVMDLRLPLMFIVPKKRGYSFLREETHLKEKLAKGEEREALFMGLGDAVIPGVLVVSAMTFLDPRHTLAGLAGNMVVAAATLVGALAGYALLMTLVAKGKAHAGLPSLNGGAILGFLLALLPLYGTGPLLPG